MTAKTRKYESTLCPSCYQLTWQNGKCSNPKCLKSKRKRGSIFDMAIITIIAITLIIGIITVMFVATQINNNLPASVTAYTPTGTLQPVQAVVDMIGLLDGLIVFVIIGMGIGSVILARQAPPQNSAFWYAGIIFLIVMGLIWGPLTNAVIQFMGSPQIASTANQFTYTTVLVSHLPLYFWSLACLLAIATWGKQNQSTAGAYYQ